MCAKSERGYERAWLQAFSGRMKQQLDERPSRCVAPSHTSILFCWRDMDSLQQPQPEPRPQRMNCVTQRGLRHTELRGGPGKALLSRHYEKGQQFVGTLPRHS